MKDAVMIVILDEIDLARAQILQFIFTKIISKKIFTLLSLI